MENNDYNNRIRLLESSEGPGKEEDTIWLLSYADLITLLFTFFVVLFS
ncbi:MAG: flagellar motor protein MotB, partial [Pseudobdellovibrionaceae bacterium]